MIKENEMLEAIKLIREMAPIIDPEEDFNTIVFAEEQIAAAEARRKKELEEVHANLKTLSKILDAARISSTRPPSVPSAEAHAVALNELDATRLSLAKAISDTEGLVASKEAELARLKEETQRWEECDPAIEHGRELTGNILRLKAYKDLGFEPIFDKNEQLAKILVTSDSGDVYACAVNDTKSRFDYTNRLWKLGAS